MEKIDRIEINTDVLAGKPVIKGTRLSVQFIIGLLAQGTTFQEIIEEYEGLTNEDIFACLKFATSVLELNAFFPLKQIV
jgi:uncharacterized protein (DUF433 family)